MRSVREGKNWIVQRLTAVGVLPCEAAVEAQLILEHVLGDNLARQIMRADETLAAPELDQIEDMIRKRESRMPLQYVLGYGWFLGRKFAVEPGVFIPRTDTETLVDVAKTMLERHGLERSLVSEIGIGSGAIAVSLLSLLPELRVVACEIEPVALAAAAANASIHGVLDRLELIAGDWLQHLPYNLSAIISNPPYIPRWQAPELEPEVLMYEPERALFGGGDDGLDFYRDLAKHAREHLCDGRGLLAVEVGDGQSAAVARLFDNDDWLEYRIYNDVNGLARVVAAVA